MRQVATRKDAAAETIALALGISVRTAYIMPCDVRALGVVIERDNAEQAYRVRDFGLLVR